MLGTTDMDQTLSDVNNDFASYLLFVCPAESKFLSADVLSSSFEAKCFNDGSNLVDVPDIENPFCPRCGSKLSVVQRKPLSATSEESEAV
jgi:uncharacterized paraquat-inducible protein A